MAKRVGSRGPKRGALPLAAPVAMLALPMFLIAPPAQADWKSIAKVEARETYTDNAGLMSGDTPHGQFISELTPSLSIANNGPRLKLNASIIEHLFDYAG